MARASVISFVAAIGALGCGKMLGYDDLSFDAGSANGGGPPGGNAGTAGAAPGGGGGPNGGGAAGVAAGGTSAGGTSAGGTSAGGTSAGGTSTTDPYEQARQTCVDHINELRATKGLAPYQRWTDAEACVDLQVTDDEQTGKAHGAWSAHKFPCNGYGSGQNECLGGGAAGIVGCLDSMWGEKDQAGCAGCDQCTNPSGCADCDFYGNTTGDVCGHYVNMSSKGFSMAACGFSSQGGWAAINFQ